MYKSFIVTKWNWSKKIAMGLPYWHPHSSYNLTYNVMYTFHVCKCHPNSNMISKKSSHVVNVKGMSLNKNHIWSKSWWVDYLVRRPKWNNKRNHKVCWKSHQMKKQPLTHVMSKHMFWKTLSPHFFWHAKLKVHFICMQYVNTSSSKEYFK
jgi:hypothetical protein